MPRVPRSADAGTTLAELGSQPAQHPGGGRRPRQPARGRRVGRDRPRAAGQTVKVVGVRPLVLGRRLHDGPHVRIGALDRVVAIDRDAMTATVEAGIPLWRLNDELAKRGLALSNLGDIDRQTIAGATSTGTHGTGLRYGSIAAAIVGLELVTAGGEVVRCSATRSPRSSHCARVGLGALGVVTQVTLQCEPLFRLRAIEVPAALGRRSREWDDLVEAQRPRRLLLVPAHRHVHASRRATAPTTRSARGAATRSGRARSATATSRHGAHCGARPRGVRRQIPAARGTGSAGTFGRTELVDLSYHVFCSPRLVRFVEMEYAIPRARWRPRPSARSATSSTTRACSSTSRSRSAASAPTTSRSAWRSGRETCYLAVHLSTRDARSSAYFRGVEAIMDGLRRPAALGQDALPDAATLAPRYPEWARFRAVRRRLDPDGRFRTRSSIVCSATP